MKPPSRIWIGPSMRTLDMGVLSLRCRFAGSVLCIGVDTAQVPARGVKEHAGWVRAARPIPDRGSLEIPPASSPPCFEVEARLAFPEDAP
jgi:hypothetical protein